MRVDEFRAHQRRRVQDGDDVAVRPNGAGCRAHGALSPPGRRARPAVIGGEAVDVERERAGLHERERPERGPGRLLVGRLEDHHGPVDVRAEADLADDPRLVQLPRAACLAAPEARRLVAGHVGEGDVDFGAEGKETHGSDATPCARPTAGPRALRRASARATRSVADRDHDRELGEDREHHRQREHPHEPRHDRRVERPRVDRPHACVHEPPTDRRVPVRELDRP